MPARGFLQVLVLQALFFSPILPPLLLAVLGICHESPVVPQVGEDPPSRLQGRPPSRQGLRDLQIQPAFQGSAALSASRSGLPKTPAKAGVFRCKAASSIALDQYIRCPAIAGRLRAI